jgi:hypothetical protein
VCVCVCVCIIFAAATAQILKSPLHSDFIYNKCTRALNFQNFSPGYPGGWGPEGRPPVAWAHTEGTTQALAGPVRFVTELPQAKQTDAKANAQASRANPGNPKP